MLTIEEFSFGQSKSFGQFLYGELPSIFNVRNRSHAFNSVVLNEFAYSECGSFSPDFCDTEKVIASF